MTKFSEIPNTAIREIEFLLGDSTACTMFLKPILEDYFCEKWVDGAFVVGEPAETPDLYSWIYDGIFKNA